MKAVGGSANYRRSNWNHNHPNTEALNQEGPISPNIIRSQSWQKGFSQKEVSSGINTKTHENVSSTQPINAFVPPIIKKPPKKNTSLSLISKCYTYSTDHIHRMQIFYCAAMNRYPGLFAKSSNEII